MAPGDATVVIDTPAGRLGLSICYDVRFPELYRRLVAAGAQWLVVPSAFTVPTGEAHWEPLLRARAIENLCYVVASGQWGLHANGRRTWGHSVIIDFWGRILAQLPEGEGVITGAIDLAAQAAARRSIPALAHRRDGLFQHG
jgi:nitrilase